MMLFRLLLLVCIVALLSPLALALPEIKQHKAIVHKKKLKQKKSKTAKSKIEEALRISSKAIDASTPSSLPVSVQGILVPRGVSIRYMIQVFFILSALFSLQKCLMTAGIPHVQAIWRLLHDEALSMPPNYLPSSLDVQLANIITSSTKEMLPPIGLPSMGPLLALVCSTLAYIGITILLPRWFTTARVYLEYKRLGYVPLRFLEKNKGISVLVHIDDKNIRLDLASAGENDRSKSSVICELKPSPQSREETHQNSTIGLHYSHPCPYYFELNQCRFYYDSSTGTCVDGGPILHMAPIHELKSLSYRGLSKAQRAISEERYKPYNQPKLATPTIMEAFSARISSPLVVVQLLGRFLTCLEEGPRALIQGIATLGQHYINARQAIFSARYMAREVQANVKDTSSIEVMVLRSGKNKGWTAKRAHDLVPGDIFTIDEEDIKEDFIMPVDALILDGQSLVNEAVLTGESIPQSKTAIDFDEEIMQEDAVLDLHDHRGSVLFAGTTIVHCSSQSGEDSRAQKYAYSLRNESCVTCLAVRTGTYSSKGELLRALKSSTHVGAISNAQSEKDAMRLIASLSTFAVASCISLFIPRELDQKKVSGFRRLIQCTRIAIASIPSDLPLALSAVARSCSRRLREEADVVCSEPGSLLTAAYIDTVVFDKTGTLTADTQSLSKLVSKLPKLEAAISTCFQRFVLAGCHSLINLSTPIGKNGTRLVGDPLDLAALQFSGWKYNQTADCYYTAKSNSSLSSDPVRLWQIKTFPFDPNKRLSSALVLVETADEKVSVWRLTKGSPDKMATMFELRRDADFNQTYSKKMQQLEARGYRSIALGAVEESSTSRAIGHLFPNGLSTDEVAIRHARAYASSLHRSEYESGVDLAFYGFACFDAALRPSSKRVVDELYRAGIKGMMLTGDAVDAALAVAEKVGLIKAKNVAILETTETIGGKTELTWRIVKLSPRKSASFKDFNGLTKIESVNLTSTTKVLKEMTDGNVAIATSGPALELVLTEGSDQLVDLIAGNLSSISVIARATPSLKKKVISTLKERCTQKVLMCGDGVNDVAAMKAADVAVALLNGFGSENSKESQIDFDDERRRKNLSLERIGSNRKKAITSRSSKRKELQDRVNTRMRKAQEDVRRRAAVRQGKDLDAGDEIELDMQHLKDMVSATMEAAKKERQRARSLKLGGGDAARILAQERQNSSPSSQETDEMTSSTIKPGEASLAASFSCLHPSIGGVDSILRAGVATAACALATQEGIALHSLMACYHLASLYRDGFRYGKRMWPVELFMYQIVESARYTASCTPRSRLPPSRLLRPAQSMFHGSFLLSTVAQAAIHLATMAVAVSYGRHLEKTSGSIKSSQIKLVEGRRNKKLGKVLSALAESELQDENEKFEPGLFRRPPFRPNYETNIVFIMSILQSTVSSLINHKGKPYYRTILESRELCFVSAVTALFSVVCITGNFPFILDILELRPLPSRKSKYILLGIITFNVLACIGCKTLSEFLFLRKRETTVPRVKVSITKNAADAEETLLIEEAKQNRRGMMITFGLLGYLVLETLFV